jgi:hypothetical protein
MNKAIGKIISLLIAFAIIFTLPTVVVAQEQEDSHKNPELTTEQESLSLMTEEEVEAFWDKLYREAEVAVTPEMIAEAQRFIDEEEQFYANLTPEKLWEGYLDENPEIFEQRLSSNKLLEIKKEIDALYETIMYSNNRTSYLNAKRAYGRYFSEQDGLTIIARSAIELIGSEALTYAKEVFPNNMWKEDAFRHYIWNFNCVKALAVGITQNGRLNSTRIYTTNYELVNNLLRRNVIPRTNQPTATELAIALNLRNNSFFNRTYAQWNLLFDGDTDPSYGSGRDELMDLWNNERGREDGVSSGIFDDPIVIFNNRWNANTVIKSNSTTDVSGTRRLHIWSNSWYVPVR